MKVELKWNKSEKWYFNFILLRNSVSFFFITAISYSCSPQTAIQLNNLTAAFISFLRLVCFLIIVLLLLNQRFVFVFGFLLIFSSFVASNFASFREQQFVFSCADFLRCDESRGNVAAEEFLGCFSVDFSGFWSQFDVC